MMNSTNAANRTHGSATNGSAPMNGAAAIRAAVIEFGRFIRPRGTGFALRSRERLEHQLAHRLERVEHAISLHRHRLEVWRPLHPLPRRQLLHEVLPRVKRIRR